MLDIEATSIQAKEVARLPRGGTLEKSKGGLYRLTDHLRDAPPRATLIDVCEDIPNAVICLLSALDFHDLIPCNPSEVYVAIPHAESPRRSRYPPAKVFYFPERFYSPGVTDIRTQRGDIRIYNREKTICDMFRYRCKFGETLALEALKTYLSQRGADINALQKYATICRLKTMLMTYLKAMAV